MTADLLHDYNWIEDPLAWSYADDDPRRHPEPVHLITCGRCRWIRTHPEAFPPLTTAPGQVRPLSHDQLRFAANAAKDEGDHAEADRLWRAWEAGEDRRQQVIEEGHALADREHTGPRTGIDLEAELDARGWATTHRAYRREKRLL